MAYMSEQQQQRLNCQIAALPLDEESRTWLEADLAGDLPEYDWGESGIPAIQSVRFVPGEGLVVAV